MDVVALAQHGVDYAVATLGTATTPDARAEALPAGRRSRVLLRRRRGRAHAPRGARSRTRCPSSPTASRCASCSCPTARTPTRYVRAHGKEGFESAARAGRAAVALLPRRALCRSVDLQARPKAARASCTRPSRSSRKLQNNAFRVQVLRDARRALASDATKKSNRCAASQPSRGGSGRRRTGARAAPRTSHRARGASSCGSCSTRRSLPKRSRPSSAVCSRPTPISRRWPRWSIRSKHRGHDHRRIVGSRARFGIRRALCGDRARRTRRASDFDDARADLEGVMTKLELSSVEAQYRQLLSQTGMSDAQRRDLQTLSQRLSELKGGSPVGVVPRPKPAAHDKLRRCPRPRT